MAEVRDDELGCPRCGESMSRGFLDAGKGPFRWVSRPKENKTIFGGDLLAPRHFMYGHRLIPGARCEACRVGVFAYDEQGRG